MSAPAAFIAGCQGTLLLPNEAAFFREADPWGFILFARNLETPDQIRKLTADLRDAVGREAPILIDQEGGRVQRLRAPHWREWLPPLDEVAKAGPRAAEVMRLRYRIIATELRDIGIDVNCAPEADLARSFTHPFLLNRCYSSDPKTIVDVSRAVADGMLEGGVLPILKHIPGHGAATVDSHQDLPRVDVDEDTLWDLDFAPFQRLTDLPMAMTAHIVFNALDPKAPVTTSEPMVRMIREGIGFEGLLMTDDISMHALQGTMRERCQATLDAGVDMILHCNGDMAEMQDVANVSPRLSGLGATRADAALAQRITPNKDLASLLDQWDALMHDLAA